MIEKEVQDRIQKLVSEALKQLCSDLIADRQGETRGKIALDA